jgi:tRNA-dihydrouridine synthase A
VGGHRVPQTGARPAGVTRRAPPRPFAVAPMMDWTTRHYRRFARGLTRHALLYTEMITANALVHGDAERLLAQDRADGPVALQLGGDDPILLARAARLGVAAGYAQIDLNVGCPSERVQRGRFGACLMADPAWVATLVAALSAAVAVPVTVKHRLGIDDRDDDVHLHAFVAGLAAAGVDGVTVHARKAWLSGLSPRENRTVPPLQPERVFALARAFPDLPVTYNGGVRDLTHAAALLAHVDGVMVGRAAIEDPFVLAGVDQRFFADPAPAPTRRDVVDAYLPYLERERAAGVPWAPLVKPLIPLVRGVPSARAWRRALSEPGTREPGPEVVARAAALLPDAALPDAALPDAALRDATLRDAAPAMHGLVDSRS